MDITSNKWSEVAGTPPGTLVHIGKKRVEKTTINLIIYNKDEFIEKDLENIEQIEEFLDKDSIMWININGIHEVDIIQKIGDYFKIHPLILEDVVNTNQRPKIDTYDKHMYIALKMLDYNKDKKKVEAEHISLILGEKCVISFQERIGDIFNPIRERLRNGKGRIRRNGADYLVYALMDTIIDNYFVILEKSGEKIEKIEKELIKEPTRETLSKIHFIKREMIFLRRSVWPLREVINRLLREESSLVRKKTDIYFRDVYDHTIQVIDALESYRDMVSGMIDIYLSSLSNKMNEVMKVLTIFATIFIPLTFIAGVYGMNFRFMPELNWRGGYFGILSLMFIVGVLMLFYFKRKDWL